MLTEPHFASTLEKKMKLKKKSFLVPSSMSIKLEEEEEGKKDLRRKYVIKKKKILRS